MEPAARIEPTVEVPQPPVEGSPVEQPQDVATELGNLTIQLEAGKGLAQDSLDRLIAVHARALEIAKGALPEDVTDEAQAELDRVKQALDRFTAVVKALQPESQARTSDTAVVPPKEEEGGGDDDEGEIARAAKVVEGAVTESEVTTDPNAERNAASKAILDKLSKGNFSVGGSIDKARVDVIRDAIVGHLGEELAARFDTEGNIVIGVPQTDGSYLRNRVITIDAKQDAGIVDWIKQSLSKETVLLRETQHTVPVEKNPATSS